MTISRWTVAALGWMANLRVPLLMAESVQAPAVSKSLHRKTSIRNVPICIFGTRSPFILPVYVLCPSFFGVNVTKILELRFRIGHETKRLPESPEWKGRRCIVHGWIIFHNQQNLSLPQVNLGSHYTFSDSDIQYTYSPAWWSCCLVLHQAGWWGNGSGKTTSSKPCH